MSKLIKVTAVMAHPDYTAMRGACENQLAQDLDYAVGQYHAAHAGKATPHTCLSHSISAGGRWLVELIFEVPNGFVYSAPFLREISKALSNERGWKKYSTVGARLLKVTGIDEVRPEVLRKSNENDPSPNAASGITTARITFEIVGSEEVIAAIKAIVEAGAVSPPAIR